MITGIIGNPIKHSLSPILHAYWLNKHKIESSYNLYELKKNELKLFLKSLKKNNIKGLNVTIPYKTEVIKYLDYIAPEASDLGAVNTIKVGKNNKLYGFNTDTYGFIQHLNKSAPAWKEKTGGVSIIGAGGASRAIIWSLLKEKKTNIRLYNRSKKKAQIVIEDMKKLFPKSNIIFCAELQEVLLDSSILINCSSLGMKGQQKLEINLEAMNRNSIVYDIVYSPLITELLFNAENLNYTAIDGLGMLLNQAVPAFEMWHGKKVTANDALRAEALKHLKSIK